MSNAARYQRRKKGAGTQNESRKFLYEVPNGWSLYEDRQQTELADKLKSDTTKFDLTIRGKKYDFDLITWMQTSSRNGKQRKINHEFPSNVRNLVQPTPRPVPIQQMYQTPNYNQNNIDGAQNQAKQVAAGVWKYQGTSGWHDFGPEHQVVMENFFKQGIGSFNLFIGGDDYEIDLNTMKQVKISDRKRRRNITRFTNPPTRKAAPNPLNILLALWSFGLNKINAILNFFFVRRRS